MVKHIVSWNFKPELSPDEYITIYKQFCENTNRLSGIIPGIADISLYSTADGTLLAGSSHSILLCGTFHSEEALNNYIVHPEHVKLGEFVRANFCDRSCVDFVE